MNSVLVSSICLSAMIEGSQTCCVFHDFCLSFFSLLLTVLRCRLYYNLQCECI